MVRTELGKGDRGKGRGERVEHLRGSGSERSSDFIVLCLEHLPARSSQYKRILLPKSISRAWRARLRRCERGTKRAARARARARARERRGTRPRAKGALTKHKWGVEERGRKGERCGLRCWLTRRSARVSSATASAGKGGAGSGHGEQMLVGARTNETSLKF